MNEIGFGRSTAEKALDLTDQQRAEITRMAQLEGIKHWRTKDPMYLYASTGDDWHPMRAFWATPEHRADIVAHRAAVVGMVR